MPEMDEWMAAAGGCGSERGASGERAGSAQVLLTHQKSKREARMMATME